MKTKLKFFFLLALILLSTFITVHAQDGEYIVKFYDGYKIPDEIVECLDPMMKARNIYKVSDISVLNGLEEHIEKQTPNIKYNVIIPESNISPQLFSLNKPWQFDMIGSSYAHDLETYGNEVRVAVVDTGCYLHDDLKDNIEVTKHYYFADEHDEEVTIDDDVTDSDGHGTHVAGIITQVAPEAKLVILKCMDGSGSYDLYQLLRPIYDAVGEYGCSIINTSWIIEKSGLDEEGIADIEEWINFLGEYAVIISAVGNGGGTALAYPAALDNVIGVGSVGSDKGVSSFSRINESVTLVAPGEDVVSTSNDGGYISKQGTSMAAPFVSGLAAIALSVNENLTSAELREILINSCDDLGNAGYDQSYGYGLINGEKMIGSLMKNTKTYTSPITDNTVLVLNKSEETLNGIGIWAEYDSEGNYIKSSKTTITLGASEKLKETCSFETDNMLKFFLWDSVEKLNPLAISRERSAKTLKK